MTNNTKCWCPAWHLDGGVVNATEDELEAAVSSCERIAIYFGGVVVIGLVIEIVLAIDHPPYDSRLGEWGSVFADVLVAVGVMVEVLFSARGTRYQSELQRRSNDRLSLATTEAGKANLEVAWLKAQIAPRVLSKEQYEELQTLNGQVSAVNVVWHADVEPSLFAAQIINALMDAGITVKVFNPRVGMAWTGIHVVFDDSVTDVGQDPLSNALQRAGLWGGNDSRSLHDSLFLADVPRGPQVLMVGAKYQSFAQRPYHAPEEEKGNEPAPTAE